MNERKEEGFYRRGCVCVCVLFVMIGLRRKNSRLLLDSATHNSTSKYYSIRKKTECLTGFFLCVRVDSGPIQNGWVDSVSLVKMGGLHGVAI